MSDQAIIPIPLPPSLQMLPIPQEEILNIDSMISGSQTLPSFLVPDDQIVRHLLANYRSKPVMCRVGDKIYHYDGTKISISPLGDASRFVNSIDATEGAVAVKDVMQSVGFVLHNTPVSMAPSGYEIANITKLSFYTLSYHGSDYFDSCLFGPDGTCVDYIHKNRDQMTHTGDETKQSYLYHGMTISGLCEPVVYGVVGYRNKELRTFTRQSNLVELTIADGSKKWVTCEWNFTPVTIGDALVAGIATISPNQEGNMKMKVYFKSYTQQDIKFDTGAQGAVASRFYKNYCDANTAAISRVIVEDEESGDHAIDITSVTKTETPRLVTEPGNPVPKSLDKIGLEITNLTPSIFGGHTGIANLAFPCGHMVTSDDPVIVFINSPSEIDQSFKDLCTAHRCILILNVDGGIEKIDDVCLYGCHLMTPQSTLVIYDKLKEKYYPLSGPCPQKEVDDSVNISELYQFHLENPLRYPTKSNGKIYTDDGQVLTQDEMISHIHGYFDYIDQLQMCVTPDKWEHILQEILQSTDNKKKETRKLARQTRMELMELKMTKASKTTKDLVTKDITTLSIKLAIYDNKLKRIKEISRHILKYSCHPLGSKTFGSSKKLSGDVQGQLRKKATKALRDRVTQMLSSHDRFIEDIEDMLDNVSSEAGWMIIGDPQQSVLDGPTVAVCNEMAIRQNYTSPGLPVILPNQGGRLFIPVPVQIKRVNLTEAYQEGGDIYLYLALLASNFVACSQSPFDDEPINKMIKFLIETHDQLTTSLSASYIPDDKNTTTQILATIRYLISACWKGFRDGMFSPELSRYGGIIPMGQVPMARATFKDYDLATAIWFGQSLRWSSSNFENDHRSFMVRIVGDLCKSLWVKYVQPMESVLKQKKKEALNLEESFHQDRNNLILRFQLYLVLKILYSKIDLQKLSITLFDSHNPPSLDFGTSKRHHSSTQALIRISNYEELRIPSEEFNQLVKIFVKRTVQLIMKMGGSKSKRFKKLVQENTNAYSIMRQTIEYFLQSKSCPFLFETMSLGDEIDTHINRAVIYQIIQRGTDVLSAVKTKELGPKATPAIIPVQSEHEQLLEFGLLEELAVKYLTITPWESLTEKSQLEMLGIGRDQTIEITKVVFKYWDNPDDGIHKVIKMMNLL